MSKATEKNNETVREEKIANLLGLAQRAGKLAAGGMAVEKALAGKKTVGVLLATDAAESTQKICGQKAASMNIPVRTILDRARMGRAVGHDGDIAAVAVLDAGFWRSLAKLFD